MEYNEWLKDVVRLECLLFTTISSYQLIEEKKDIKYLTLNEREQLYTDVFFIFQRLVKILQKSCPTLTKEDIVFCCLFKVGVDRSFINCCMGTVSYQAFNQRKYRIRKKMKQTENEDLFRFIFSNKTLIFDNFNCFFK